MRNKINKENRNSYIVTDLTIYYQAIDKLSIALNVNNLLNVLPEWAFKADNAAGQAIIDDTSIISIADGSSGLTHNLRMKQMPLLLMVVTLK